MAIDPRISLGVQPLQLDNPLAQYGKVVGIRNAQNQNALAEYQLDAAERNEKVQNMLSDAYAQSTDPATGKIDYNKLTQIVASNKAGSQIPAILKTRREMEQAELTQRETGFKVEKAKNDFIAQAKRDTSQNPSDANLTAYKEDLLANPLFNDAEKTQLSANVDRILAMPIDQRRSFMSSQGASASELKPSVQTINRGGQTDVISVPAYTGSPTTAQTYADVPLPKDVAAQKREIAKAGASNISMSTEKAYGGQLANKVADADIAKLTTAERAPEMAANADRVLDLLKQGNVFTGSAADIKLNIAKGLNILGANNDEKIANTETLISGLAKSTLSAVKSSGLGSGQGFTDKDLQFLQDAEGGRITLNSQTLERLAKLSRKTAEASADAWNKRATQIPKSATEGTGLSIEPINVPKRNAGIAAPAVGSIQNGYRFKGGDPAVQTNWEKQ